MIGRLPTGLRVDVATVWIHRGEEPFGGGNKNLLIHTGQADRYLADGILEETLVHEAAHTSLDGAHSASPGWLAAQTADGEFISTYARDNPTREDIAESFLPYIAVRYRADRISPSLARTISETIPNRIAYFDSHPFDSFPLEGPPAVRFLRGDCNNDGAVDISDAVKNFLHCFDGRNVTCAVACDTDGDRNPCTGVTDGVRLLMHIFRRGAPPPMPFPECGTVEGDVDCATPPASCR